MKKRNTAAMLALVSALALSGCGGEDTDTTTGDVTDTSVVTDTSIITDTSITDTSLTDTTTG